MRLGDSIFNIFGRTKQARFFCHRRKHHFRKMRLRWWLVWPTDSNYFNNTSTTDSQKGRRRRRHRCHSPKFLMVMVASPRFVAFCFCMVCSIADLTASSKLKDTTAAKVLVSATGATDAWRGWIDEFSCWTEWSLIMIALVLSSRQVTLRISSETILSTAFMYFLMSDRSLGNRVWIAGEIGGVNPPPIQFI